MYFAKDFPVYSLITLYTIDVFSPLNPQYISHCPSIQADWKHLKMRVKVNCSVSEKIIAFLLSYTRPSRSLA